jgi:diadenylate cyclase
MPADLFLIFKWQNIIDILVITFIIHRIFLMLRGSAAFQMMLGLISLLVLQAVAQMGGLVLTSWFFRGLGAIALLAIVILFRREIRELLIQTNPLRMFLSGNPPLQSSPELETLITSVFNLANTRTGALIVIKNQQNLSERLHDGYELNGRLIPQIIESIFTKKSPLHDGAIVISGNRIQWVRTFLPLTTSRNLPRRFGTRHRAAIGLSERTDATVLVVSEERGEVVWVEKGSAKVIRNPQHLRHHLMRLSAAPVKRKTGERIHAGLIRTAGFALIFLFVSTFWGVSFGRQSLIQVNIPIDFRNIPENIILKGSTTENVDIQISGNRMMINDLKSGDVRVYVNLRDFQDGVHAIGLESRNVELPTGLSVIQMSPSQIRVELDREIEKKVAVEPRLIGGLPDGFQITRIHVEPNSISVRGPASELASEDVIYTNPIVLNELEIEQRRAVLKVSLSLPHNSIKLVDAAANQHVQVIIEFTS